MASFPISLKTKISVNIFYRRLKRRAAFGGACVFLVLFTLLSSCSTKYFSVRDDKSVPSKPSDRPSVKPDDKPSTGFQELRGEKKQIVASWYGKDFHGKPTASGEIFNMYDLTCAHKEYPFGTKLKVLSTLSNKDIDCIVNDRGPFIAGRDLDLSYAAAKSIDMIGPGTAPVIIEPLGRDMKYVKYIRYDSTSGVLTIQAGAFREETNASRLKMALELNYKDVYITKANVDGVQYHRVRIGKFSSKDDARKIGGKLADEGYNVLITRYQ
ncbi:MAG: SPOR domain-containing protein [Nitrospirae bacterium]|nr:MAG: SPOR domain-containing protein [Nitrospirota bacterium]